MGIQITSNSTHLVITNGENVRTVSKSLIQEVSILRGATLKLDIGGGPLRNIFITITDITNLDKSTSASLINAVNALLAPPEIEISTSLRNVTISLSDLNQKLDNLPSDAIQEPIYVDESNPEVIYKGYAKESGISPSESKWAILRTTMSNDISKNEWSNGTQDFTSSWNDRTTLTYA